MSRIQREWALKALLVTISLAFGLVIVEAYLRYDNQRPPVHWTEVTLGNQSYSFHDSADAFSSYDQAVVFIGDSFTAGLNCRVTETFPAHFEKLLVEPGVGWHVVNIGVPGYDIFEYLVLTRDLLEEATPGHVVVTLYLNDIEPGCKLCHFREEIKNVVDAGGADPSSLVDRTCRRCGLVGNQTRTEENDAVREDPHGLLRTFHLELKKRLLSYIVLKDAVATTLIKLGADLSWGQTAYPGWWNDTEGDHFQVVVGGLQLIKAELEKRGVGMTVLLYPDATALDDKNPYVSILQKAADSLESRVDVTVASGYDAFLGNPEATRNMYHSLADRHPNCKAHRLFGEWAYTVVENPPWQEKTDNPANGSGSDN